MKNLIGCLLAVAVAGCSGCAHHAVVSDWYESPKKYSPTQEVQIFRTQKPDRPYTEIAELTVDNRANISEEMKAKGCEIGADAVIITGDATGRHVIVPVGGMMMGRTLARTKGIAIKYKN